MSINRLIEERQHSYKRAVGDMDDDPRSMRVPNCVRGVGARSIRCCNGDISFYCSDNVAITMTVLDIGCMEFWAQRNLFAVRVDVSPITQVSDIVAAMDPLLDPLWLLLSRLMRSFLRRRSQT